SHDLSATVLSVELERDGTPTRITLGNSFPRCSRSAQLAMKNREWLDKGIDPRRAVDRLGKRNSDDVHRRARDQPQQACTRGYLRPVDHFELLHVIRTPAERAMGLPSLVAAIVGQTSH